LYLCLNTQTYDSSKGKELYDAANEGKTAKVKELLDSGRADPNYTDSVSLFIFELKR
jgi:hypothetical protein